MIPTHKSLANVAIVLLVCLQMKLLVAGKSKEALCPIGFLAVNDTHGDPVCYRMKEPETFAEKFENCTGNLDTLKLLKNLKIIPADKTIWTDYKNMYDGGPFVDWSFTKDSGDLLQSTYDVNRDSMYGVNEELCVVIDPVINFKAVRCDEKHYRFCIIDVYEEFNKMNNDGCDSLSNVDSLDLVLNEAFRFSSPMPTCLLAVVPMHGNKVRMTWNQSQKACKDRGGSLLNRGWRYSNYPLFSSSKRGSSTYALYPFGVRISSNLTLLRYDTDHDSALIPESEWLFDGPMSNDTTLGAVLDDSWTLVNSSYTFFDVLCEKTVQLKHVNLTVYIDNDDEDHIILTIDDRGLRKKNIYCFTDSITYHPQRVNVNKRIGKPGFILTFVKDGYYWCTHKDSTNFYMTESNKVLQIKVKNDTTTLYAVKLTALGYDINNISKSIQNETENLYAVKLTSLALDYNFSKILKLVQDDWKNKIEEYVSYSTKYRILNPNTKYDNRTIWKYRNDRPTGMRVKNAHVVLKRVYLNSRSALLHVKLEPGMMPVSPGQWDDIQIDFMRPAYFCEKKDNLSDRLILGETRRASACKIYNCVGDFNEGVQLIITAEDTCYTPKPIGIGSSVTVDDFTYTTEAYTDVIPTTLSTTTASTTRHQKLKLELNSSDSSEEDSKPRPDIPGPDKTTESWSVMTVTSTYSTVTGGYSTVTEASPPTTLEAWTPPSFSSTTQTVITVHPIFPTTPEITTIKPLPPEDQLIQVMGDLNSLLNNTDDPILVADIEESFNQVDGFLGENEDLEIPGDLLHILDKLGARIDLNGTDDAATVRDNVALLVANAKPGAPVRGLKIATRNYSSFTEEAFQIIREDINDDHLMADANEVVIQLPESLAASYRRISFVIFRNDRAFQSSHGLYSVNSRILSVNIENTTKFQGDEVIDIYLTPLKDEPGRNETRSCAFWKFLDDGTGSGYWSQDGCSFVRATADGMLDTCRCDHLTHFAEVLIPRTVFTERNEKALEMISIVGCCLSIFGLIWVGVTALLFRSWRRDYSNKIWLQLCISIFIMSLAFLIIIFAQFEEYDVLCMLTGIFLHFSVLSSFCWMLVAAVLSYRRLVTVFSIDASHKLLRASAFAWGVPCAVVGILLSVAPHSYSGRLDDKNPTAAFCYPSGLALWLSVFAPIALMLIVNWTLFALIVRSVFASRRNHPNRVGNRHSSDKHEALRCASVSFFLVFLFGLPWLFGMFAMNLAMAYCFVLLSTFQGFVLFLFFVLGNKKTRDLWLNKLKIKQTKMIPVTSSTYTNNRSTAGIVNSRSDNQTETIERKISKPKSLTSLDDSRFS